MTEANRPVTVLLTILSLTAANSRLVTAASSSLTQYAESGRPSLAQLADTGSPLHDDVTTKFTGSRSFPLSPTVDSVDCGSAEGTSSSTKCGASLESRQSSTGDAARRWMHRMHLARVSASDPAAAMSSKETPHRRLRRSSRVSSLFSRRISSPPSAHQQQLPSSSSVVVSRIAARSGESQVRNRFVPWGGKRSPVWWDDGDSLPVEGGVSASGTVESKRKGGFQPWGGKRISAESLQWNDDLIATRIPTEDDPVIFDQPIMWADSEAGRSDLDDRSHVIKRGFHPWGGK